MSENKEKKQWAKGVILVNEYKPPKDKTIEDYAAIVAAKVVHLQLPQEIQKPFSEANLQGKCSFDRSVYKKD